MRVSGIWIVIGLMLPGIFFACNDRGGRNLSSDLVTNPNSAEGRNDSGLPVLHFDKDVHDFGKLIQGEKAICKFRFTNSGTADLLITQVNTSCGCTSPKFPRTPVKPGKSDEITVTFDSEGKKGMQQKSITIVSNCQPSQTTVWIKAMVVTN
jgi:hypothetical protein